MCARLIRALGFFVLTETIMERMRLGDYLKLTMEFTRPRKRPYQIISAVTFEGYYQLCKLLGYPTRHFLEPVPEEIRDMRPGERILLVWPHLPLHIRMLDWVFSRAGHADWVPYTTEAEERARASDRRTMIIIVKAGELRVGYNG
jgi:hypothetical protein